MRAQQVRNAVVTGKALTDEESDALELELPVNIPGVKLSQARGGSLAAGGSADFDLAFPAKVQPGSRAARHPRLPFDRGLALRRAGLPHDLPLRLRGADHVELPAEYRRDAGGERTRPQGQPGYRRRCSRRSAPGSTASNNFQHEDGGWGWWETDESHPFMTAYVVAGLAQAKAAGVQVDAERIEKRRAVGRQGVRRRSQAGLRPARLHAVCAGGGGQARCERAGPSLRAAHEAVALRARDARPGAGTGEGRSRRRDRGRAGAGRPAGQRAGMVDGHARSDAGFLRGRHARGHRLCREVPLAPAAQVPAAAEGGAMADESSQ